MGFHFLLDSRSLSGFYRNSEKDEEKLTLYDKKINLTFSKFTKIILRPHRTKQLSASFVELIKRAAPAWHLSTLLCKITMLSTSFLCMRVLLLYSLFPSGLQKKMF